jgi:hypothetical protein
MKPTADTSAPLSLPLRTLVFLFLVLLLGLLLGGTFEYLRLQERASEQASEVSLAFGRSSAILIQPLVLSDDRISLNYLLNELARQPLINGLRLTAPDQTLIALAGDPQGRMHTLELVQSEVPLGQLTVWSNADIFSAPLRAQLFEVGLLLALTLGLTTLLLALSIRRSLPLPAASEPSFAEIKAAFEQPRESDRIPEFDFSKDSEPAPNTASQATPPAPRTEADHPSAPVSDNTAPTAEAAFTRASSDTDASPIPADEPPHELDQPATAAERASDASRMDTQPEPQGDNQNTTANADERDWDRDQLDNDELVSLLKPERSSDLIPRFTPRTHETDILPEETLPEDGSEAWAADRAPKPAATADLGISAVRQDTAEDDFSIDERADARTRPMPFSQDEPLELYPFEQELELTLAAEEAGYLLLIDTRSAHSDNVDEDERDQLLRNYRTLANSAARIYSGEISALKDGNLRILFADGDDKDSHGINALCCAMLFTWLYKQYNQRRIRAFRPVMNLHMALVRGAAERIDRMQEEAHFLTRTTQSNELISHTALTEAPLLKEMLLQKADIRREDEDKVLILSISEAYQTLLEKQARHLLGKLEEREGTSNPGLQ